MTADQFCFWLQGYFELSESKELSTKQVAQVKAHLDLAFVHDIDKRDTTAEQQAKLQAIHDQVMPPLKNPDKTLMRC